MLTLRVWQSAPADQVEALRAVGVSSGLGSPLLRIGYLKAFMDGTLGSQTALMLDGSGVRITSGEELAAIVLAGAEAGFPVAVHAIGDGANREALDAFERTRPVWEPSACAIASSTRSFCPRATCRGSPSSGSRPRSSLARALDGISPSASGRASSTARTRIAL